MTVANAGPSFAQGIMLDDPTPVSLTFVSATAPRASGFPCAPGTLGAGDSAVIEVTFAVPADDAGDHVVNTASVASAAPDPYGADDSTATPDRAARGRICR